LTEINQLENFQKSMIGMNNIKKWERDKTYNKVLYYSKATLNYLNKSSINTQKEIQNFEENLERLGLNIPPDKQKIKKSQNVSTDVIMLRMREKLNEKMKQKKR
jgi:predicted  nucleic acid-binding Zn-ribbon protein